MAPALVRRQSMTWMKKACIVLAALAAAGSSGCAWGILNRGSIAHSRNTTIGQELIDLKEAKEKGALSDEEYTKVKKAVMEGGPFKIKVPGTK
jgi:hypothetical protein